jgi:hypothetical protein
MIIISYMEYQKTNKTQRYRGTAEVNQVFWQAIVFVGLLVTGALSVFRF